MLNYVYDVKEFGALADGHTLDTKAIQAAVDACHKAGGGRVLLGPGEYLSGTIHLRSNVTFYLEAGATLKGSTDIADYDEIPRINPEQNTLPYWFLVYAEDAENISIEGRGTIDGQGRAFWTDEMVNAVVLAPKEKRPRSLVAFINCRNLLFRRVALHNSPTYTLWLIGCDMVNIDGLTVINPYDGPNTDALDIDCCRNVRISNCHIQAGDDCIAVKSDTRLLHDKRACENITVSNCSLSSSACAIRIGYEGDAPIRNCVFSNIIIYDSTVGINLISIIPGGNIYCAILEGAFIEDIIFSDIVMRNINEPIFIWLSNETERSMLGGIKNVSLNNIIAHGNGGSYIGGTAADVIESVSLRNVKLIIEGQMQNPGLARPGVWGGANNPYALWCSHVCDLTLDDLSFDWRSASGDWHHEVYCDNVSELEIRGIRSRGFQAISSRESILLQDSSTGPRRT